MVSLATLYAKHTFDFDATCSSQYFYLRKNSTTATSILTLDTIFVNQTVAQSQAIPAPFLAAAQALPGTTLTSSTYTDESINNILYQADDAAGFNIILGSLLIPTTTYSNSPEIVRQIYQQLLDAGALNIPGHLVAGGQVVENANISSAVNPAWRTAKTHGILDDSTPLINTIRKEFQTIQLPILEQMSGANAGAYSNEADVLKPNFQTTFFGPNYATLSTIKTKYDPNDLFIVPVGVGSERRDQWGLHCVVFTVLQL
ncbi:hypothetical protein C8R44DRAFT_889156 [Mycena epipterygia]|nr:hypothetical protein C8R44DRAFT_889156 [Mycena epipterygia]